MVPNYISLTWAATDAALGNRLSNLTQFAIVAGLVMLGLANVPQIRAQTTQTASGPLPSFEVASVKPCLPGGSRIVTILFRPGRFTATCATIKQLLTRGYQVGDFQLSGGPGWISSEKYDIEAKESDSLAEELPKLPPDQRKEKTELLIRSLLADRFKLKVSHETKELPIYVLVVGKNGPKLPEAKSEDTYRSGMKGTDGRPLGRPGHLTVQRGQLTGQGIPIEALVVALSQEVGRIVVDQTGLKGKYDIALQSTPDQGQAIFRGLEDGKPATESALPPNLPRPRFSPRFRNSLA